jgi:predicted XRE-type DNA-binding protein
MPPPDLAAAHLEALKIQLAREAVARTRDWSQLYAAAYMQVAQGTVSELRAGRVHRVTLDRLVRCLCALRLRVSMRARAAARGDSRA